MPATESKIGRFVTGNWKMQMLKISDFNISGEPIPEDVADKILIYFIRPLNRVMEKTGIEIRVSKKSGYRPLWWEKARGRSGGSHHVFLGRGAADITFDDFLNNVDEVIDALLSETEITRIAVYPNDLFLHVDYAMSGERWLFDSNWVRIKRLG